MDIAVQNMKAAAFMRDYTLAKQELTKSGQLQDLPARAQQIYREIEYRYGELTYSNYHTNPVVKDAAFAVVQVPGFSGGTVASFYNGIRDILTKVPDTGTGKAKAIADWYAKAKAKSLTGKDNMALFADLISSIPPELKGKAQLTEASSRAIATVMTTLATGYIACYLYSGRPPKELKDFIFYPTGKFKPDGTEIRMQPFGYQGELFNWLHAPGQTAMHKQNPVFGEVSQVLQNRNYYGVQYWDPESTTKEQLAQFVMQFGKDLLPFSLQSASKLHQYGFSWKETVAQMAMGQGPAPASVDQTDATDMLRKVKSKYQYPAKTVQESEIRQQLFTLENDYRKATRDNNAAAQNDVLLQMDSLQNAHKITKLQGDAWWRRAQNPPLLNSYKDNRIEYQQAYDIYKAGTPEEKALWHDALLDKIWNQIKKAAGTGDTSSAEYDSYAATPEGKRLIDMYNEVYNEGK